MEKITPQKAMTKSDAKRLIRKYIAGSSDIFGVAAWFFALAAIVLGVLGTFLSADDSPFTAREFSPVYSKTGSYAYIDAVAISDWICKYDIANTEYVYYTVADSEDYLYMVRMEPGNLEDMTAQNAWWNGDKTGTPPQPYRLYGEVKKISDSNITDFAAAWNRSEDEFKEYFGDKYLLVGVSPAANRNKIYRFGAIISGVIWLISALLSNAISGGAKKAIRKLSSSGDVIQAAEELSGSSGFVNDLGCCRATNDFIFGRNTGAALPYKDILWFYEKPVSKRKDTAGFNMIVNTKDRKNIKLASIPSLDSKSVIDAIKKAIQKNSEYAIYGDTKENQKEYKRLCRHFKEGGGVDKEAEE